MVGSQEALAAERDRVAPLRRQFEANGFVYVPAFFSLRRTR